MFERERHAVDVSYGGKPYRFYARELGYAHFRELSMGRYEEPRWVRVMEAVTVAAIEGEDGKPAFTAETWRDVPRSVAEPLTKAAWRAQGVDVDKEPEAGAETEGNG